MRLQSLFREAQPRDVEAIRNKPHEAFSELNECHTHEDDTVVLRMFEESECGAEVTQSVTHAVSNKVGTTTLNACAAWRGRPTARAGINQRLAQSRFTPDTKISDTEPDGPSSLGAAIRSA